MKPGGDLRPHAIVARAPLLLVLLFVVQSTFIHFQADRRRPIHPNRRHQRHQNVVFVACEVAAMEVAGPSGAGASAGAGAGAGAGAASSNLSELHTARCDQDELARMLFERFNYLFSQEEKTSQQQLVDVNSFQKCNSTYLLTPPVAAAAANTTDGQSPLDQRTTANLSEQQTSEQRPLLPERKFFRVLNRVFSRVELPDTFRRPQVSRSSSSGQHSSAGSQNQSPNSSPSSSSSSLSSSASSASSSSAASAAAAATPSASNTGNHCALHIGCIDELPNFPSLLKLKPNVSATFTIYSSSISDHNNNNNNNNRNHQPRAKVSGQRIVYEPIMHYRLEESSISGVQSESELQTEALKLVRQQQLNKLAVEGHQHNKNKPAAGLRLKRRGSSSNKNKNNYLRLIGAQAAQSASLTGTSALATDLAASRPMVSAATSSAAAAAAAAAATITTATGATSGTGNGHQHQSSWKSAVKIAHSLELPFDLAQLEQVNFNSSLTTRVIIGGYFAKEDEEWIDELVRQWLLLEPCNVIKVSWQDSNRGLYHTAAYNSRIVGRQLSLFLHYLNELHSINLNKFHLVGHSLGAHIAGFVGQDNEGRLARITGLDPAGPIFFELQAPWRLDPSDAKFVDVMHTNGGTITKGALGLAVPSGHVDYYCNGGSLQPGCYFSSVTKSIMDPVERVACNHRRSYRYFTELVKLAIATNNNSSWPSSSSSTGALSKFPQAFLFQVARQDELARLVQPELTLITGPSLARHQQQQQQQQQQPGEPPLRRRIEFHSLRPRFPSNRRALYFFRTRSEAPFFSSKQFAITIRSEQLVKRKLALLAKINQTLVAEAELDELNGSYTFVFAPHDPHLIDARQLARGVVPDLWLMWRQRSFNLLLGQQNELYLSSIELNLIDIDIDDPADAHQDGQPEDEHPPPPPAAAAAAAAAADQTGATNNSSSTLDEASMAGAHDDQLAGPLREMPGDEAEPRAAMGTLGGGLRIVRYLSANHNQLDSILKTSSLSGHFALARNQWHKFEGKLEAAATGGS